MHSAFFVWEQGEGAAGHRSFKKRGNPTRVDKPVITNLRKLVLGARISLAELSVTNFTEKWCMKGDSQNLEVPKLSAYQM